MNWLRATLEKARLWHHCVKELHCAGSAVVCQQLLGHLAQVGRSWHTSIPADAKMKLAPWVEIAEGKLMEKALRQGTSLELRVQTVNRLRESIGFSLAKDILRSTPQALTVSQSQQRDLILSKAKAVGERQARFEVYGKVDNLQDCLQRLPNEWYTACLCFPQPSSTRMRRCLGQRAVGRPGLSRRLKTCAPS